MQSIKCIRFVRLQISSDIISLSFDITGKDISPACFVIFIHQRAVPDILIEYIVVVSLS